MIIKIRDAVTFIDLEQKRTVTLLNHVFYNSTIYIINGHPSISRLKLKGNSRFYECTIYSEAVMVVADDWDKIQTCIIQVSPKKEAK